MPSLSQIDRGILIAVNSWANRIGALDHLAGALDGIPLLSGIPLAAVLIYKWFTTADTRCTAERRLLTRDFIAILVAGPISRGLQIAIPSHARPIHDPALHIRISPLVDPTELNAWGSFPSDHASVYFCLAIVIALHFRRAIAIPAVCLATMALIPRVYFGYHWPSDILGGLAFAAASIWLCRRYLPERFVDGILSWEKNAPALFYALGFILCGQIATLFEEPRHLALGVAKVLKSLLYASRK